MKRDKMILSILFGVLVICQSVKADEKQPLKIMDYNVLVGFNGSETYKNKYKAWLKDKLPDIIAYQEMSKFTAESFAEFAKSYGHPYTAFFDTGSCCPIALSSKYPISDVQKIKEGMHHGLMLANVLDYQVAVLHLNPFDWKKRYEEINKVIEVLKPLADRKVIMMGDFNSRSPVDKEVYKLPEKFDETYTVLEQVQKAGFIDSYWQVNKKFTRTHPTRLHSTVGYDKNHYRIDYIWVSPVLESRLKSCEVVEDAVTNILSDHYPILLTLER